MIEPNSELQSWELPCQDLNSEWRCPRSLTSMLRCKMERLWHEQSLVLAVAFGQSHPL